MLRERMLRERMLELVILFPVMATINILIIMRENTTRLKKNCFRVVFVNVNSNPFLWASFDGEGQFQAIKKLE